MVRRGYTPEQIINKLCEADIFLGQGAAMGEPSKKNAAQLSLMA